MPSPRRRRLLPLALVILAAAAVLMLRRGDGGGPTPTPLGREPGRWVIRPEVEPRTVAVWMTGPGDATAIYRQLDEHWQTHAAELRLWAMEPTRDRRAIAAAADLLIAAGQMAQGGVFAADPAEVIAYQPPPRLVRLTEMQQPLLILARIEADDGRSPRARDIYRGLLALGVRLHEERYTLAQWEAAAGALAVARYLAESDGPAFERLTAALRRTLTEQIEPPLRAIRVANPHPGDIAALAAGAGDRLWRVEATLALGRLQYSAPTSADRQRARQQLDKLAQDPDPIVALAARVAAQLTAEEFGRLR